MGNQIKTPCRLSCIETDLVQVGRNPLEEDLGSLSQQEHTGILGGEIYAALVHTVPWVRNEVHKIMSYKNKIFDKNTF